MDLDTLRQKLDTAPGMKYWRALDELADVPEFQQYLFTQYPGRESEWTDVLNRRKFLGLIGASLALAGVSGCGISAPTEKILPYVKQPAGVQPGKVLYFATAMTLGGYAEGVLVESHTGRPTKLEGNQDHPASLGATTGWTQAEILSMYDPDRSKTVRLNKGTRTWDAVGVELRAALKAQSRNGAGLRILTETITSPSLAAQIAQLLQKYPGAKWHQYEPMGQNSVRIAAQQGFGQPLQPVYHFENADVIVSLDADIFSGLPGRLRYTREFAKGRKVYDDGSGKSAKMNRLYAFESSPSSTGAKADHRWPVKPSRVELIARKLAASIGGNLTSLAPSGTTATPPNGKTTEPTDSDIAAVAADLNANRGRCIVVPGDGQPPSVHLLAHAINEAMGAVGSTVTYIRSPEAQPVDQIQSLTELCNDMEASQVQMLLILGGNPVYNAPSDLKFGERLKKVALRIHHGLMDDETSQQCQWHLPETHTLEAWGDARAYDGTVTIQQPLIAPLYEGRSASEVLSIMLDPVARPSYEIVRQYWAETWNKDQTTSAFENDWRDALNTGVVKGSATPPATVKLVDNWQTNLASGPLSAPQLAATAQGGNGDLELVFRHDPSIYDGRFANNGWLQETSRPLTRVTWDNLAIMSLATATRLGVNGQFEGYGGTDGQARSNTVTLKVGDRSVTGPVWILPGHPDDTVTVNVGYGRTHGGRIANGVGFDTYLLRTSTAPSFVAGLSVTAVPNVTVDVACTQYHHMMLGRDIVRSAAVGDLTKEGRVPGFEKHGHAAPAAAAATTDAHKTEEHKDEPAKAEEKNHGEHIELPISMYPDNLFKYDGQKWGMAIDLSSCMGCNACVVACQAENNIPVVGKNQVSRGREMAWLRIDTYYGGEGEDPAENPKTFFQPVPCMQCENAPCEIVCPVEATSHSAEGLNDMTYNRCVGTRYCSNNCPYKVRRFNFLQYSDFTTESLQLMYNPQVTVRTRGVMEKCTYCVQRINQGRIDAQREERPIADGDIVTACQAACAADAIVFGDLNDPKSRVARRKHAPLNYSLLEELNTNPRTTYLAAIGNPNPALGKK